MEDRAEALETRLESPLLVAALLTVPAIAVEQSDASYTLDVIATVLNWCIWLVFAGAALTMLRVTSDRAKWIRDHPLDVAIVVLTPPFLPASMQAARVFRLLRLLRLVRAAGLARKMFSTEGIRDAGVLALATILGGGSAYAAVEKGQDMSAWDGVWFAMTTVTTVGYGEFTPETDGGRIIALGIMLVGIGFVAILTAAAAERFMASRRQATEERHELATKLEEIARQLESIERRIPSSD